MEKHITVIGILYIVFGFLCLIPAFIVFVALTGAGLLSGEMEAFAITSGIGTAIAFFLFVISVPGIVGGIFLLKRREWARILILILGFLELINIPFGTALGIYTIWALLNDKTTPLFARAA